MVKSNIPLFQHSNRPGSWSDLRGECNGRSHLDRAGLYGCRRRGRSFHLCHARLGHNDRSNSAFTFGNGEDLDDFEAEGIGHFLGFCFGLDRRETQSLELGACSSLRVKSKPLNRIRAGLHGGVDELADVVQSAGFDVEHIGCRVTDDFRFATLRITIIGLSE